MCGMVIEMKQSMFNHITELPDGSYGVYNFFSGEFARMNCFTRDYYDHPEAYGADHPEVMKLAKMGILVDYNELDYLRSRVRLECGNSHTVQLTICPTLQCNFSCPYCYETARRGKMDQETQEAVLAFADRMLKMLTPHKLSIVWYGGEPLLEKEIIRSLSERLIRLSEDHHIKYGAFIITNGYNLTPDCEELFRTCRIKGAQITLDGPDAATHDRTRHLRSGKGTFERIVDNIRNFHGDCYFNIRCNVHKDNAQGYTQLEDELHAMDKKEGKRIFVYAGLMDGQKDYYDQAFTTEEYVDFRKHTLKKIGIFQYKGPVCSVPKQAEYVIDERGNLYKCLEDVGVETCVIGEVKDFDPNMPSTGRMDLLSGCFEQAWPGEDSECMACTVLPICMGGCPHKRMTVGKHCSPVRYALDEYVTAVGKELLTRDEG